MSTKEGDVAEEQEVDLENLEDTEDLDEEGSELDQEEDSEASSEEDENPAEEEEFEEVDLSDLEVDGLLSGSRPEESEETKKHNRFAASQRVELKRKKEELQRLRDSKAIAAKDDPRPKRVDFLNEDALHDKYNGDTVLAQAAFEDAKEEWQLRQSQGQSEAISKAEAEIEQEERLLVVQENFEAAADKVRKKVANFDQNIERAEQALMGQAQNGQIIDGALAIKNYYGDDAPLMLAAIGANPQLAEKIRTASSQPVLFNTLARLQMSVSKKVPSGKKLSKAKPEEALRGDDKTGIDLLEKQIEEAADAGDFDLYTKLKEKLKAKQES